MRATGLGQTRTESDRPVSGRVGTRTVRVPARDVSLLPPHPGAKWRRCSRTPPPPRWRRRSSSGPASRVCACTAACASTSRCAMISPDPTCSTQLQHLSPAPGPWHVPRSAFRNTTSFPPLLHHQDGNFIPRSNGKWGAIIHYKPQPPQGSHDTSVGRGPVSVASRAKLAQNRKCAVPFCRPTGPSDHTTVTRTTIQALATVSHAARCVRAREVGCGEAEGGVNMCNAHKARK